MDDDRRLPGTGDLADRKSYTWKWKRYRDIKLMTNPNDRTIWCGAIKTIFMTISGQQVRKIALNDGEWNNVV